MLINSVHHCDDFDRMVYTYQPIWQALESNSSLHMYIDLLEGQPIFPNEIYIN